MKQAVLLFLILLLAIHTSGQKQNVDSLINVLHTQAKTYEEKRELYWLICDSYQFFDLDKTYEYASQALLLAEKERDLTRQSLFTEYQGRVHRYKSNHDSALICFDRALELAQKANDKEREACVFLSIGVTLRLQSRFEQSLDNYLKALQIHETLKDKTNMLVDYGNVANIYIALNDYAHALEYLKRAEQLIDSDKEPDNPVGVLNVYYQLASIYSNMEDPDNMSLAYTMKTLELAEKHGHVQFKIGALNALSVHYGRDKDYEKAIAYCKEALQLSESFGHRQMIAGMWTSLSELYRKMLRWNDCESAAIKAWELDTTDIQNNKIALYNVVYSNIYLNNNDKAASFLERYNSYWKTSSEKSLHNSLTDMETKYETEKKETRIASLEKERQLYVWLGLSGVLFALLLAIVLWQTLRNARKEKVLIATRSVLDGEMRERTRLAQDLHDRLSGNLSAVKIELNNQAEFQQSISHKIDNCIRDIRNTAHDLMPSSLQFGMKVALEDFAAQFPDVRFHFFGEEKRIDRRIEFVVYCFTGELVNNAVKHSGAKNINLQLVQDGKHVTLTVSDDGCGYDEKATKKGFGLKSIRDRVASCNGKMDIVTLPGNGTETTIEIKTDNA